MKKTETFALVIIVAIIIGLVTFHSLEKKPCVCPPVTAERSRKIVDNAAFIGKVKVIDSSKIHYYATRALRLELVESYKSDMAKYDGDGNSFKSEGGLYAASNAFLKDDTTECLSDFDEGGIYEVILTPDAKHSYVVSGPCDQPLAADWEKLRKKQ